MKHGLMLGGCAFVGCVLGGCHGSPRETEVLRTTAMIGIPIEKEGKGGYTPEKTWDLQTMNAPQRELYVQIQVYKRERGDVYDESALKNADFQTSQIGLSATQLRNDIVAVLLAQAAWHQQGMEDDVFEAVGSTKTIFDLAGLVVNALGGTTGGVADKAAYNVAAGALIGLRSSLEKNFLAEQTQMAILHMMEAQWLEDRNEIVKRLNDSDDSRYSLKQAATDIRIMSSEGRLADAVAELGKKAADAASKAKQDAKDNPLLVNSSAKKANDPAPSPPAQAPAATPPTGSSRTPATRSGG